MGALSEIQYRKYQESRRINRTLLNIYMTGKQQLKTLKNLGLIARTKQVEQQFIVAKYLYIFLLGLFIGSLTQII